MITAVHEALDAVSSFIAAAGVLILIFAALAIISMLVFEGVYTFHTFQALSRLT